MRKIVCFLTALAGLCFFATAQPGIDSKKFFSDETPLPVTISTDMGNLLSRKMKDEYQDATLTCTIDSQAISEAIKLNLRGHSRREICYFPPIRLVLKNETSPKLSPLKTLKLVNTCRLASGDKQLLLKEYLIYKIYNLLTEKSFRVRLLNLTYEDSKKNKKPFTQHAFLVENVDAVAKRNKCKEINNVKVDQETTERNNMTMVSLFEYMIGNTDWSVWNNHNIKLLYPKKDSMAFPIALPYDFDNSGLVNADYAVVDPIMQVETVEQRVYRGFPRTQEELDDVIKIFNEKKGKIYELVNNFEQLSDGSKRKIISYFDDFYKIINNPKQVKSEFITNARVK